METFYFSAYGPDDEPLGTYACREITEEAAANVILTQRAEVRNLSQRQVHVVLPVLALVVA